MAQSKGDRRTVRTFNPSVNPYVDHIKERISLLIDFIDELPDGGDGEIRRWKAEAQTNLETGAMYAVKAATATPE